MGTKGFNSKSQGRLIGSGQIMQGLVGRSQQLGFYSEGSNMAFDSVCKTWELGSLNPILLTKMKGWGGAEVSNFFKTSRRRETGSGSTQTCRLQGRAGLGLPSSRGLLAKARRKRPPRPSACERQ